jgi:hypothetical protein
MHQHEVLEKLNLQAHLNARANTDEFVVELLVSYGKACGGAHTPCIPCTARADRGAQLPILIHELLVIDVYKEKVWPLVRPKAAALRTSLKPYFIVRGRHARATARLMCGARSCTTRQRW